MGGEEVGKMGGEKVGIEDGSEKTIYGSMGGKVSMQLRCALSNKL